MEKGENTAKKGDLGFGHFSTAETEHDWRWRSYDGMESSSFTKPLSMEDIKKILEKIKVIKRE